MLVLHLPGGQKHEPKLMFHICWLAKLLFAKTFTIAAIQADNMLILSLQLVLLTPKSPMNIHYGCCSCFLAEGLLNINVKHTPTNPNKLHP